MLAFEQIQNIIIFPGTGNGVAKSCIGNFDIATAAYSVVFGRFQVLFNEIFDYFCFRHSIRSYRLYYL